MLLNPRTLASLGFSTRHALRFEEELWQEVVSNVKAEMRRMLRLGAVTFHLISPHFPSFLLFDTRAIYCTCAQLPPEPCDSGSGPVLVGHACAMLQRGDNLNIRPTWPSRVGLIPGWLRLHRVGELVGREGQGFQKGIWLLKILQETKGRHLPSELGTSRHYFWDQAPPRQIPWARLGTCGWDRVAFRAGCLGL